MATTTTKLGLTKPDTTDLVDIAVINTDFDKIDAASGATICTSSTRPGTPWNGQIIFETDTLGAFVWRSATSTWTSMGGSTVSSDPPATAANGDLWWDSDNGKLYIYYTDVDGSQWVSVMPNNTTVDVAENKIINGDFSVNQRNLTSTTSAWQYGFDRWRVGSDGGTTTYSAQSFTPGTAPVAGYESANFARIVTSGQSSTVHYAVLNQPIEDVRTFAGQTVTISFWAKAGSGTPKIAASLEQAYGGGGSSNTYALAGTVTISQAWTRYSLTVAVPSIAGKTIGTASALSLNLAVSAGSGVPTAQGIGVQNNTFDIWGVQVEKGSVATSFKTATGTIQGELAACQRYYYRNYANGTFGLGYSKGNGNHVFNLSVPVTMRTSTLSVEWTGTLSDYEIHQGSTIYTPTYQPYLDGANARMVTVNFSVGSSLTNGLGGRCNSSNANAFIGISAEL